MTPIVPPPDEPTRVVSLDTLARGSKDELDSPTKLVNVVEHKALANLEERADCVQLPFEAGDSTLDNPTVSEAAMLMDAETLETKAVDESGIPSPPPPLALPDPSGHAPQGDDLSGKLVGVCFRLTRRIGETSLGVAYQAEHRTLGSGLVVNVLDERFSMSAQLVDRLVERIRTANQLTHPALHCVIDFGRVHDQRLYLVTRATSGRSVRQLVEQEGPLPFGRACELLHQASAALTEMHAAGMAHGGLSADSLWVETYSEDTPERLHITDLCDASLKGMDEEAGTRAMDDVAAGVEADIEALGLIAREMLMGIDGVGKPRAPEAALSLIRRMIRKPHKVGINEVTTAIAAWLDGHRDRQVRTLRRRVGYLTVLAVSIAVLAASDGVTLRGTHAGAGVLAAEAVVRFDEARPKVRMWLSAAIQRVWPRDAERAEPLGDVARLTPKEIAVPRLPVVPDLPRAVEPTPPESHLAPGPVVPPPR